MDLQKRGYGAFFFCLQSHILFVFDLLQLDLLLEVAPVAARDDELVDPTHHPAWNS